MFRKSSFLAIALGLAAAAAGTQSGPAIAQTLPAISTQGCGSATHIPALGAAIDETLPTARLSAADTTKVTVMRELIQQLAANGKEGSARDVEEAAMDLLGYTKLWLRCGFGTFNWINRAGNEATQPR